MNLIYLDETDSTNIQAGILARQGAPSGTVVLAESQTAGRGRRGRAWESPKESAIYMSLLVRPRIQPEHASMLTLVMGLSVVEGIRETEQIETQIKWPNDVVLNKKKIAGILTEMSMDGGEIAHVIIGVGVNVNTPEFPPELEDKATSFVKAVGRRVDRKRLTEAILQCFDKNYELFLKTEDFTGLKERYEKVLVNRNQPVRVLEPGNEYSGIAVGVNDRGELLVAKEDGSIQQVYAGEVSVRGLYSYV